MNEIISMKEYNDLKEKHDKMWVLLEELLKENKNDDYECTYIQMDKKLNSTENKKCKKCDDIKEKKMFDKGRKICKDCRKEINHEYYLKNRNKSI
jgi:hypothetical protein